MKNFRIVVTKASLSAYWYADHIGEEFEVVGVERERGPNRDSCFLIEKNGNKETYLIDWKDCELVEE